MPSQIFQLFALLLNLYYFLIIARIILTWIVNSYTLERHPLGSWLCAFTDPFLRIFRRLPFAIIGGVVDISPILALFSISLLRRFFISLSATQSAPFYVVFLSMTFQLILSIISIAKTATLIITIILVFRLLHSLFSSRSTYNLVLSHIDLGIRKVIRSSFLRSFSNKNFSLQIVAVSVLFCLLFYLLALLEVHLSAYLIEILENLGAL